MSSFLRRFNRSSSASASGADKPASSSQLSFTDAKASPPAVPPATMASGAHPATEDLEKVVTAAASEAPVTDAEQKVRPGELSIVEDAAGGLGRHLGLLDTTFLVIGRIIGTGIFSTPSSIVAEVGSVGAALFLWVLGGLLSFCGLFIWIEFATMFPRSGGEKVYLEAVYRRPKLLATIVFAANAIFLGFTASGCIVFAQNIMVAADVTPGRWNSRGIALGVISFVTIVHGFFPRIGIHFMNALSVFKIAILVFIVVTGWVVLGGRTHIEDPHANFRNAFAGSSHSSYEYATALFKVLNSFTGWSNAAYVLNEVKNPISTIKKAGPLGLGTCAVLYLFANISYFAVASVEEVSKSGVTVAAYFFKRVFGTTAERALSVFVALSALGNVFTITFAQSRVNQELAKEGVLPWSRFWASNWPCRSPLAGLIVHLIPSVIVIIGPPPGDAYNFILDVEGYPTQIINLFVVLGLFWLRWKYPHTPRAFKVWLPVAFFFLAGAVFLLVVPFIRPPGGKGDTSLPYWLAPVIGIAVMLAGVLYWFVWQKLLPSLFRFHYQPVKGTLADGTVVTEYLRVPNA